jgi:hypothetical protein
MMPELFENYRGVEIFAQRVTVTSGDNPQTRIEYTCTVGGKAIRDRSIYRVKKAIDRGLDDPHA